MLDDEQAGSRLLPDPLQQGAQGLGLALGDARRGLVEEQHERIMDENHGQIDDAPRAGGQLGHELVPEGVETHEVDEVLRPAGHPARM